MTELDNLTPHEQAKMLQSGTIVEAISKGKSITQAAKIAGVSRQTAYRRLSDDYCQGILTNSIKTQIAAVPGTTKRLIKHCFSDKENISLDAIKTLQENVGVRTTRNPSTFIQNIIQINKQNNLNISDLQDFKEWRNQNTRDFGFVEAETIDE